MPVRKSKPVGFYLWDNPQKHDKELNNKLFSKMFEEDCTQEELDECQQDLILNNLGFARYICNKMYNSKINEYNKMDYDDIFGWCYFGLIKAIHTFKPDLSIKFSTYSARVMTNEVLMALRRSRGLYVEDSLEGTLNVDKDGNELTLLDTLAGEMDVSMESMDEMFWLEFLDSLQKELGERKFSIFCSYLANDGHAHQKKLGEHFNISQSYASRLLTASKIRARQVYDRMTKV